MKTLLPLSYGPCLAVTSLSLNAMLKGATGTPVGIFVLSIGVLALILVMVNRDA